MINIQKKDLFLILAIVVFMTGVGVVISYNPSGTGGTPSIMGHSVDEIDLSNYYTKADSNSRFSLINPHVSGGLYGWCMEKAGGAICDSSVSAPAYCEAFKHCKCPAEYTLKQTGYSFGSSGTTSDGKLWYSCLKN